MTPEHQRYLDAGPRFKSALDTLVDGCEIPPSFEVFAYQLDLERRANPGLSPEGLARRLSESYHRVTGFFRDTP
jgi:hypothetical protein